MREYDVIVVGSGVWGAATTWALAKRGYRVLGLDQYLPPHNKGSHGGATRLARLSNSSGEPTQLTIETLDLWRALGREVEQEILLETGTMFVGQVGSKWFDSTLENLAESPFDYELETSAKAMERIAGVNIWPNESVIWEPAGNVILVESAIKSLHLAARWLGAEFEFNRAVTDWTASERGVEVATAESKYRAQKLVIAVGAFSETFLGLSLPVSVERQVVFNFPITRDRHMLPSFYFAAPPGSEAAPSYGCPEPDGTYKVSIAASGNCISPGEMTQYVTHAELERVQEVVMERLPILDKEPTKSMVCMWSEVSDGSWLLDKHPLHKNVIVGAGCNGRGFRYGAVIGEMLADLVEEKGNPVLNTFGMTRFEDN